MNRSFNEKIRDSRYLLQNQYAYLGGEGEFEAVERTQERLTHDRTLLPSTSIRELLSTKNGRQGKDHWSYREIEQISKDLQNTLWKERASIWPDEAPSNPIGILNHFVALECIGYDCELSESLGQYKSNGKPFEVAGIADNSSKQVRISRQFPNSTQNFTAAHELGHVLLHETRGLHRDRPVDGSASDGSRSAVELEADKFATYYFLMPEKKVKSAFKRIYGTDRFCLTEETIFALAGNNATDLEKKCRTLRDLSTMLAKAERYNGVRFYSLATQFRVSNVAMAIRLEELEFMEFEESV